MIEGLLIFNKQSIYLTNWGNSHIIKREQVFSIYIMNRSLRLGYNEYVKRSEMK